MLKTNLGNIARPLMKKETGARPVKLEQSAEEMTVTGLGDANETRANLKIW